ncbi:MAG: hypothetical protein IT292_04810 [Deltaproteobacteria bacterium]|nr:hypothetical protein [Deltaproteobacteria bacterium]
MNSYRFLVVLFVLLCPTFAEAYRGNYGGYGYGPSFYYWYEEETWNYTPPCNKPAVLDCPRCGEGWCLGCARKRYCQACRTNHYFCPKCGASLVWIETSPAGGNYYRYRN